MNPKSGIGLKGVACLEGAPRSSAVKTVVACPEGAPRSSAVDTQAVHTQADVGIAVVAGSMRCR